MATDKKACVAYLDRDVDNAIYGMRKYDEYQRLTKSQIIAKLIRAGLKSETERNEQGA